MQRLTQMNRVFSVAVMASLLALTAACGSSPSSSSTGSSKTPTTTGNNGGTLNLNINAGDADFVKTLDPALPTDSISYYNIQLVNANLVKFSYPVIKVVPDLATWTVSSNHLVYTFTIRSNAKFANGDPVTAADAAWSMNRALLPATKSPVAALYLGPIKGAADVAAGKATTASGIKVLGPKKLQITLTGPYAYFLGSLTYPTADVLDKKLMQGKAPGAYLLNNCKGNNGAGPFEFVCVNGSGPNSFFPAGHTPAFNFKPNPNYYGAKAKVKIHAPFIPDTQTSWREFQAGQIDVSAVPTADISIAKGMAGFATKPALVTDYMTPNSQIPPFSNINCRLAVAYGIDRVAINHLLLKDTQGPLYDVIPPGLPQGGEGYFGKVSDAPYYNPTKAKAYLNNCPGKLNGVVIDYQNTSADLTHEYDTIAQELKAIGAGNITLKPLTFNAWLGIVGSVSGFQSAKTQITENLWIDDYPDAQDWLSQLLQTGANYNLGKFSNPTYDKLVNEGNVEFNPAKRAADYRQAMKIVLNDGAWISVGYQTPPWVVRPKLHNLIYVDDNIYPLNGDWSTVSVG